MSEQRPAPKGVYAAIVSVQSELAKTGIAKGRKNQGQGFQFRGIDDILFALAPLLARHGLCFLPRVLSRSSVEKQSAKGGALFYTTVEVEFDLVCAGDGSCHTIRTIGEATDSGDKSTNKAMSAAYKYAAIQAFCIPTEGDNDADATTHEVLPAPASDSQLDAITGLLGTTGKDSQKAAMWASGERTNRLEKLTHAEALNVIKMLQNAAAKAKV